MRCPFCPEEVLDEVSVCRCRSNDLRIPVALKNENKELKHQVADLQAEQSRRGEILQLARGRVPHLDCEHREGYDSNTVVPSCWPALAALAGRILSRETPPAPGLAPGVFLMAVLDRRQSVARSRGLTTRIVAGTHLCGFFRRLGRCRLLQSVQPLMQMSCGPV